MQQPETWDDLLDGLRGNRAELLTRLNDNHPAETPKRELTSMDVKSVNYHLEKLLDWDLVEVVAHEQHGDRIPARVFKLTERGRDAADDLLERTDTRPIPPAVEKEFEDLRQDVNGLQDDFTRLREEVDEVNARINNLVEFIKKNGC